MRRLGAAVALLLLAAAAPARADDTVRRCAAETADWPLWSALSRQPWTDADIAQRRLFPLDQVLAAIQAVPRAKPMPAVGGDREDYGHRPFAVGRPGRAAYLAAALLYETDLPRSIPALDAIVADPASGFRAAAAYSAARAVLRLGDLDGAARRIAALTADPTLEEFWGPALDLFSTLRYQGNEPGLNAAELAELGWWLTAPTAAMCDRLWDAAPPRRARDTIATLLPVHPADRPAAADIAAPMMIRLDPVLDAAAALAAPQDGPSWRDLPAGAALLPHARERWQATLNPLWAVALVEHSGDLGDRDVVMPALRVLRAWPGLPLTARYGYAWRLVAQAVRLSVIHGRVDEALAAPGWLTDGERAAGAPEAILGSGIEWFLDHGDPAAARAWALKAAPVFGLAVPDRLKPALVLDLDELYHHPRLGLPRIHGAVELGNARTVFDLYPARRLIELSRRPEMAPDDRRALVGAAWVRAYALARWSDLWAWLPDLSRAFPELDDGVQLIEDAWLERTRRHLATRLLLKTPGLVAMPSWARPPGGVPRLSVLGVERQADIRRFDTQNPSDGNWWCGVDPEAAVADAVEAFRRSLRDPEPLLSDHSEFRGRYVDEARRAALSAQAQRLIATVPLLKGADRDELSQLAAAGSATKRLAEDAVAWAAGTGWLGRQLGWDALAPETLALAVRATRFGCRRPADNGPWSRAAWLALRQGYPASPWAAQTPYWFGVIRGPR